MTYEELVQIQLQFWQHKMQKKPSLGNRITKGLQDKINNIIPEKVHAAITVVIEKMIKGVLFGAQHTTTFQSQNTSFQLREVAVKSKIDHTRKPQALKVPLPVLVVY